MTKTSTFGNGPRQSHNAKEFYNLTMTSGAKVSAGTSKKYDGSSEEWANRVYNQSSEQMSQIPDNSVALAFTSPPYNVGKDYTDGDNLAMDEYLELVSNVGLDVYRALMPGGRYVVNVANVGRKPYIPLHAYFYQIHQALGFMPMGEIIWRKAKGASGACTWGSWKSAKSPVLRDIHEYLLVFTKERFGRPDKGESTIGRDDFMASTLSIWEVKPESARRIGHPAPFPVALASKVINLYSYQDDVVLDPFMGSGTTCVAAADMGRRYVGYDISATYCDMAERRIRNLKGKQENQQSEIKISAERKEVEPEKE